MTTKDFDRSYKRLEKATKEEAFKSDAAVLAHALISFAVDSPVPTDQGDLAGSGSVQGIPGRPEILFGFNKEYALFQDALDKTKQVIRPKRARMLYIPLTDKGRRGHRRGANPDDEGLERGVDYVLGFGATVFTKPYGSHLGPNRYFSGTLERRGGDWFFTELAKRIEERLKKAAK